MPGLDGGFAAGGLAVDSKVVTPELCTLTSEAVVCSSDQCSLRLGWARIDTSRIHESVLAWDQSLSHRNTETDGRLKLSGFLVACKNGLLLLLYIFNAAEEEMHYQ